MLQVNSLVGYLFGFSGHLCPADIFPTTGCGPLCPSDISPLKGRNSYDGMWTPLSCGHLPRGEKTITTGCGPLCPSDISPKGRKQLRRDVDPSVLRTSPQKGEKTELRRDVDPSVLRTSPQRGETNYDGMWTPLSCGHLPKGEKPMTTGCGPLCPADISPEGRNQLRRDVDPSVLRTSPQRGEHQNDGMWTPLSFGHDGRDGCLGVIFSDFYY